MKKIILCLLLLISTLSLTGCKNQNIIALNDHVIERRDNLFLASDSDYLAMLYTGEREEPYALDGIVNPLVPFGILVFGSSDPEKLTAEEYNYTLKINEETIQGTLEKNQLDNQYYVDIERQVPNDAKITLNVAIPNSTFEKELINISKDFKISQLDALAIAAEELKVSLENIAEQTDKSEVLIKILKDFSSSPEQKFYWYVAVIGEEGQTAGILIDTQTGEIISKK